MNSQYTVIKDDLVTNEGDQEGASNSETLASSVYQALLNDILTGKLRPGHKLRLQALKVDYNVGNSPLREALNRLSANGMVVRQENKGFRVSSASVEELEELIRTRCWLEERALRESIKNGGDEYQERLILAAHRLSKVTGSNDGGYLSPQQEELHREYHRALISACNSSILIRYCDQLHEQTLRYQNLVEVVRYREGHEGQEHKAIVEAVLAQDADKATDLLTRHYQITGEILIKSGSLDQTD
ncbi:MAG: GntR family transcriptional regulator [Acidiferrobacterales bacterium]|nr:GntR family transcriptional regulator [Acidiferrobacterales bacterium]